MSDLYDRLRDRSQRLCITDQDLADNILFREAADSIMQSKIKLSRAVKTLQFYTEYEDLGRKATDTLELLGEDVV